MLGPTPIVQRLRAVAKLRGVPPLIEELKKTLEGAFEGAFGGRRVRSKELLQHSVDQRACTSRRTTGAAQTETVFESVAPGAVFERVQLRGREAQRAGRKHRHGVRGLDQRIRAVGVTRTGRSHQGELAPPPTIKKATRQHPRHGCSNRHELTVIRQRTQCVHEQATISPGGNVSAVVGIIDTAGSNGASGRVRVRTRVAVPTKPRSMRLALGEHPVDRLHEDEPEPRTIGRNSRGVGQSDDADASRTRRHRPFEGLGEVAGTDDGGMERLHQMDGEGVGEEHSSTSRPPREHRIGDGVRRCCLGGDFGRAVNDELVVPQAATLR